jgi:hypothetical protein
MLHLLSLWCVAIADLHRASDEAFCQLRQYEFYFVNLSTAAYLVLSSALRAQRAAERGAAPPVWLIAMHCAVVSD